MLQLKNVLPASVDPDVGRALPETAELARVEVPVGAVQSDVDLAFFVELVGHGASHLRRA